MTRKILIVVMIVFTTCAASYGQYSVGKLFGEFSDIRGVERIKIGKLLMKFVSITGQKTLGVESVEVLDFSHCESALKNRLDEAFRSLEDKEYETLLRANAENEQVRILLKMKNETIRELVIATSGTDPALIRIKGKIRPAEVERLINKRL
jgi:hypothetical protein